MEISVNNLRCSVRRLRELLQSTQLTAVDDRVLQTFLDLEDYTEKNIGALLEFLSVKLLDAHYSIPIAIAFEHILLMLITSAIPHDEKIIEETFSAYQWKCITLATLVRCSVDAKRYAISYFRNKPAPFQHLDASSTTPKSKKSKNDTTATDTSPDQLSIVKCCYQLLSANPVFFKELWDWSAFIEHSSRAAKSNDLQQLYCNHILATLTNMTATQLRKLNAGIPAEILLEFDREQSIKPVTSRSNIFQDDLAIDKILTLQMSTDLVTNIEGVLLPIFNKDNYKFYAKTDGNYDKIVKVDSTKVNLRSIALGIAAAKAICLSGPVGCGKTTLVEYLARKTGRICPKSNEIEQQRQLGKENRLENGVSGRKSKEKIVAGSKRKSNLDELNDLEESLQIGNANGNGFLRIQLGDQTDSKMLLGQYRCTDVPGEFIWLPGVLTQAIMHGYWLLLEDLDSATQDTYTILSSLLENNYLSVPGFRDCVKIEPGFQLFVTVRTNKSSTNSAQKCLYSLLEKYLYTINILPLSRNELCKVVSTNYPKLATIANRIVDVFLTFSSGAHSSADNLRQQETGDKADNTEQYIALPFEQVSIASMSNSGRMVSTRDLIKLCQRSNPMFSVTSAECAYFVFQNAVDVFCSYLPQGKEKTKLITSIGAKLGIIQSRCEFFADEYKPDISVDSERIKVGRTELYAKSRIIENIENGREEPQALKRQKLTESNEKLIQPPSLRTKKSSAVFSFTRMASCLLERVAVCVSHAEPVLLVGETGVGKTSAVQYLAERTQHNMVVVNMNNQSDVSDLVGGFKPVDLTYVLAPLRVQFETLFRYTFDPVKNETFLTKLSICYNQSNFSVIIKLMIKIVNTVFGRAERNELRPKDMEMLPRWEALKVSLLKLNSQLSKSINISFAFIPGSLVNCIKNGDWILLDEINLASAETLECLSTILEPDGSVVLLEKGDFTPVKRHPDFRIFACMNPNTDIGKKDLSVGIRNRFTEFFVDELTTDADLSLLISDYLNNTGIQKKSVMSLVKLYKKLKELSKLELNDGLGNRPVFSLRTLCRSLRICAKNLCGSIERNLYESFCMSFLTQLDPISHSVVLKLIQGALLSNAKAILKQGIPKPGENYLNFEGYWIQQGPQPLQECANYILTDSVKENLKDLARIISIGKLPVLLQGPTSAGKTSLIEYVAKRSGNHCLRINNHEHTDLQEYIGTYVADVTGKLSFKEGILVQAMRNGYWIILDELNLASTDILEALNRVLDDNRELYIPETQTVVKAHSNFMLFATQNPPGLYGGRKTLSRAFKNRFIELHFSEIPRHELEIILEKRCLIPASYAKKMVMCMSDLQKNRKTTTKNIFTLRDLFRWGNRYTFADKKLLEDQRYDWNQHLVEEGYLVLSAKVRTDIEIEIIEETLYKNFRKRVDLRRLFDAQSENESSPVTKDIILSIRAFKQRTDIVWTRNMTRMAVLTAKALQFHEPVLLVGPTGCGKTTVCQILASIRGVQLRILNCHMHTEGADFLGGLRPCRQSEVRDDGDEVGIKRVRKLFEWADGPLILAMQEGSYFMADEISLAEDSVLERLNCILEPERTVLLAEKGGISGDVEEMTKDFLLQAEDGFEFLATMNPGGDFGKKELSPALRNRFTEIWCLPSDSKEDLIQIASNCMLENVNMSITKEEILKMATFIVEIVLHIRDVVEKFRFSVRDILAWANYMVSNAGLSFPEKAIFGLETIFLDALELLPHESLDKVEQLKVGIIEFAIRKAAEILNEKFTLRDLQQKRGDVVRRENGLFGIKPFFIPINYRMTISRNQDFLFDAPTTKKNLFRLLSALSLRKPVLLEGPPGVGKTSIVENIASAIGYRIVRINLCEHTDLSDLFGTDLPAEDNILEVANNELNSSGDGINVGSFVWRDGPLLAALKSESTWILLDELNLAPQSVLEGLNAILDHRGEVYIPELNKTFVLSKETRIFACQNPLKQGGGRKGLPQSFLNRFNKVYLRKLTTEDLLFVVNGKYGAFFAELRSKFVELLHNWTGTEENLFDLCKKLRHDAGVAKVNEPIDAKKIQFDLGERLVQFSELLDRGIAEMEFGYRGGPFEINLRDILRWCDLLTSPETGFIFHLDSKQGPQHASALFRSNFENFLLTLYERMKLVYYQRMRCEQDKLFIRNTFAKIFNCDAEQLNCLSEDVAIYWTNDKVYLNDIVLERSSETQVLRPLRSKEEYPLLLSSQREVLKNVIECVHMEKPVMFCGATDTGKTKLIDTLCTLSNQICNTDTIDDSVTGSFQQIDLNRHLEEISQSVEGVLMSYLRNTMLEASSYKVVAALWHEWSAYNTLATKKLELYNTTAMSEELENFRKRIKTLNNVIQALLQAPTLGCMPSFSDMLVQQQRSLSTLEKHVRNADSLNTGGSFEWVDSKIVKSLKSGQYILLEHVNLCSSAVLDRLNPVFEPKGNLLISEKGVASNEGAEIVEKAPNFRAFLTVDPKNGELSRAMRNRCVELALSKDIYSVDDMRMIVYTNGVHDISAITCLLQIHKRLTQLTEINNYNISHLTQFAFLTTSYARIGYIMERAIYVAGMEVYVYSANSDLLGYGLSYYQNKLREIVLEETKHYAVIDKNTQRKEDHLANIVVNSSELNELTLIKMQTEPLKILLKSCENPQALLSTLFSDFEQMEFSKVQLQHLSEFFIYMLYECSSLDDVELRYLYVQNVLVSSEKKSEKLQRLSQNMYACVQHFRKHCEPRLSQLPWNSRLFPRVRAYSMQLPNGVNHKAFCLSAQLIAKLLLRGIPQKDIGKASQIDALAYSQAVAAKKINDRLNNTLLENMSNFLLRLLEVLSATLNYADFGVESYVKLITAFLWFNRLLETAEQKLYINKELNTNLLDKLVLHFKWLEKDLLQLLATVLPNYRQLNTDFDSTLHKLVSYLLSINPPLNLLRKVYTKQLTHFAPFYQKEQIQLHSIMQRMDRLLNVTPHYGSFTAEYIVRKFVAQQMDSTKRARTIINTQIERNSDYKFRETHLDQSCGMQLPQELKIALQRFMTEITEIDREQDAKLEWLDFENLQVEIEKIAQFANSQDELPDEVRPKDFELKLLALREYYLCKALLHSLTHIEHRAEMEINELYCEGLTSISNSIWLLIKTLKTAKYQSYRKVWEQLINCISNIKSIEEFEQLISYLNGSYRHFNSYQHLIWNAALNAQLNNLSTRTCCTDILKNDQDVHSLYAYEGPSLLSSLIPIVFQNDGTFRPVPLKDLNLWKVSLKQVQQLLWQNSTIIVPEYSVIANNFKMSRQRANTLLYEVKYVKRVCENLENENFHEYNEAFEKLVQFLSSAYKDADILFADKYLQNSLVYQQRLYHSSLMSALIGAIEICLLTFTPLIDPVEKNRLKNLYIVEDINCLTTMTTVYDFMKIIMRYKNFGAEIYEEMENRLKLLKAKQEKCSQKLAQRPEKCLYSNLVQDVTHFMKTNCEPHALLKLVTNAQKAWLSLTRDFKSDSALGSLEETMDTLNKMNLWIGNSQRFINHTLKPYTNYYQDFLQPLQYSIDQLRFGFEGLKVVLTQVHSNIVEHSSSKLYIKINEANKLHNVLANVSEFPTANSLHIFDVASNRDITQNRSAVFSILDKLSSSEHNYFRLLRAKLLELRNMISISSTISEEIFRELDFVFCIANQIWQSEEERRRKQKAEDESLYVNKTKCETEDEEILELQEIEEHFPTNLHEDFGEFILEDTLEKVVKLDKRQDLKTKCPQVVRDQDYAFLAENFINIMEQYTHVYYYKPLSKPGDAEKLDFIEPFQERMQVFVQLFAKHKISLTDWLDEATYNSFSFAIGLHQQFLTEIPAMNKRMKSYNFYKDSNIPEIIGCTDVLNRIEERVDEQLALYPEHASLMDIKRVIERLRLLPATSPVVRFNTGFQILRQKVSQWNEVAHKGNHLRQEEVEVAEYVQKWTKLELQCWRNCLTQTYEKIESTAYKYWFFIYNLFQEYILDHEIDNSYTDMKYTEKRFGEGEILEDVEVENKCKVDASDIVRILRQFVEAANYGDFHVRLHLLQAFELYLHNIERNVENALAAEKKNELIAGLRNLQIYFEQFTQEIEEAKKGMRTPIEKKLKEFVKIESYNKDLSYFSMRNNVARAHRQLNKFLKEYQQQLQQKITPVFQPKDATVKDYNFEQDKGRDLRYDSRIKYYMVDVKCFVAPQKLQEQFSDDIIEEVVPEQILMHKVGKLFKTARNVVKETVANIDFPKLIIALDTLLCEQLERCEQLRNLTVDRTKDRPKQVLEAKQILQQKRKGLTDLFKVLSQLGVSYKTGLMELSLETDFEDFKLPPFCIKTMFGAFKDKRISTNILHLNNNLDKYYAKCVFKLKLLRNIMLTPLSELGPPNIERIKGFAVDMFLLVQNQRRLLANTAKSIYDLHALIDNVKQINDVYGSKAEEEAKFNFRHTRDVFLALRCSMGRIRYVFEQFNLLLGCVPDTQSEENYVLLSTENRLIRHTAYFDSIAKTCEHILETCKSTLADMLRSDTEFLSLDKLKTYQATHNDLVQSVRQILHCLKSLSPEEHLPIARPFIDLLSFVEQITTSLLPPTQLAETNFENIDSEFENILHGVLLSLQKLYKKYPKIATNTAEESSPKNRKKENEHESDLCEQHLKKKLYAELEADWHTLNVPNVIEKLSNILLCLKLAPSSQSRSNYTRKLIALLPLLEQYHLVTDYYLFQQLGAHKVSTKMLSVMLTVFVEIGTKGFCVPPDLMQDEEGQSKKEQKEGEGFGLEDGTGEKDASDKIESEDQLEDAKRPEDRRDEDDKQDDCKEEKGIEMSDDFDGKMQDIEKPDNEEDDSGESEDEEDLNKEMGETEEGADKLDDQIWGDDEEPEEEEEKELDEEEDGKGSKDEKDTHNDLDTKNDAAKNDGKDDNDNEGLDATDEQNDKRKQKEKDIDSMNDEDVNEEQVNDCHNELEEPPEPEEMDLGDMNNVDDEQEDDEERQGDENPFDLDTMKENMQTADDVKDDDEDSTNGEKEEEGDASSDSENDSEEGEAGADTKRDENDVANGEDEPPKEDEEAEPETQRRGETEPEEPVDNEETESDAAKEEKPEEHEQSKDKSSKEENVQSVPESENKGSADQVQNENDKDVKQEQKMDEQETGEEKEGIGQAENETNDGGHQGIAETKETVSQEERKNERKTEEKRKQGRTNEERALGEAEKNKIKQLKTIDKLKEQNTNNNEADEPEEKENDAEEYQHVKEPKNSDKTTLDNATEEQSKKIQHQEDEQPQDEPEDETNEDITELDEEDATMEEKSNDENLEEVSAEKIDNKSENPSKSEKTKERADAQEEMEVEGEIVPTMTVTRSDDTTAHCIKEILMDTSAQTRDLSTAELLEMRKMYQQQLSSNKGILPQREDYETWQTISNRMVQNARELCEQLRLILEPTKCTRLKGDYRTGRRINMKKIIPYIASQFRKDKIWLRRTKPAQRDYKITIAIDDSKSMHHNNSKTLTLEAISLVSQALTLLESGRLSIVSFGESPQIILNHTEQFDGPKLVNSLNFAQDKTKIAELLDFIRTVNTEEGTQSSDNGLFENLLLVLSDGRNIYSEGKARVRNAIKLARLQRIFLVYIIIDNPENKDSILDIQTMEMLPDKRINIKSYLDDFPFPYYVIVRDLNQLPLVLSEAMRQWFELVNSEQ